MDTQPDTKIQEVLKNAHIERLLLKEGDVLLVTIKSDDIDEPIVARIREQFKLLIGAEVKVAVFGLGTDDDIRYTVVGKE